MLGACVVLHRWREKECCMCGDCCVSVIFKADAEFVLAGCLKRHRDSFMHTVFFLYYIFDT